VWSGSESAGVEQAAGYRVGEVAEAEGGAAEVFEAAVDRFTGPVRGAGVVEVGQARQASTDAPPRSHPATTSFVMSHSFRVMSRTGTVAGASCRSFTGTQSKLAKEGIRMSTKTLIICIVIGLAVGAIGGLISRFVFEIDDGVAAIITAVLAVAITCGGAGVTSAKKKNK
jgi:hypothetical protein